MHGRTVFPVIKVSKILPSKNPIFGDFQVSFGGTKSVFLKHSKCPQTEIGPAATKIFKFWPKKAYLSMGT